MNGDPAKKSTYRRFMHERKAAGYKTAKNDAGES
jgi:hypothetical protein